jgi:hypothetical protein
MTKKRQSLGDNHSSQGSIYIPNHNNKVLLNQSSALDTLGNFGAPNTGTP